MPRSQPKPPSTQLRALLCGMALVLLAIVVLPRLSQAALQDGERESGGAASGGNVQVAPDADQKRELTPQEMIKAGGVVGFLILGLSLAMLALIFENLMGIRRSVLMPQGLAEAVHQSLAQKQIAEARASCQQASGFLGRVLGAGLDEVGVSYNAVEKAMEDAAVEQSSRLHRRTEYLSMIGTIAPMLGLMGTVWGMIQAFLEFEQKANPQVAELAPGIYRALVTTLLGLGVAVPSLLACGIFRIRIDELTSEATLLAEHVFADHRRAQQTKRREKRTAEKA